MTNMEKLRNIDDIIEEIESEVSRQINKEAYEATESIKDYGMEHLLKKF